MGRGFGSSPEGRGGRGSLLGSVSAATGVFSTTRVFSTGVVSKRLSAEEAPATILLPSATAAEERSSSEWVVRFAVCECVSMWQYSDKYTAIYREVYSNVQQYTAKYTAIYGNIQRSIQQYTRSVC